jgi:hypothetical protein
MSNTEAKTTQTTPTVEQPQSTAATYSYRWSEGREVTKVALARVWRSYGLLQHVRTIRVRQRGGPSTCEIDTDARYWDLPKHARDALDLDAGGVDQWH